MFKVRVIPCLDVKDGRVVKGVNFVNLRDAGDPVELAGRYNDQGADELVFLDISASHEGRAILLDVVRRVAEQLFMPFTVGGGIRTLEDATRLIQAGAEKVSINSAAVRAPELITAVRFPVPQQGLKFGFTLPPVPPVCWRPVRLMCRYPSAEICCAPMS